MATAAPTFADLHEEHRLCHTEHASWIADKERWQDEYGAAIQSLKEIEQAIRDHGAALDEHTRAIKDHDKAISAHERSLLQQRSREEEFQFEKSFIECHRDLIDRHTRHRQAHGRITRHHERVIVLVEALRMAIGEAI
jgi:hypothetical protein